MLWMMNRGITMLATPYDESALERRDVPSGLDLSDPITYQDAIADILQVAAEVGLDQGLLGRNAREQQATLRRQGEAAGRRRLLRTSTDGPASSGASASGRPVDEVTTDSQGDI